MLQYRKGCCNIGRDIAIEGEISRYREAYRDIGEAYRYIGRDIAIQEGILRYREGYCDIGRDIAM